MSESTYLEDILALKATLLWVWALLITLGCAILLFMSGVPTIYRITSVPNGKAYTQKTRDSNQRNRLQRINALADTQNANLIALLEARNNAAVAKNDAVAAYFKLCKDYMKHKHPILASRCMVRAEVVASNATKEATQSAAGG